MGQRSPRDILADFMEAYSDAPYRSADILFGYLDKAGLTIAPQDDEFVEIVDERDRLLAIIGTARARMLEHMIPCHTFGCSTCATLAVVADIFNENMEPADE